MQPREALIVDVYRAEGDDPFICAVRGRATIEVLTQIETAIREHADFAKGDGVYRFEPIWFAGQFGEYGQCELRPGWGFDEVGYEAPGQESLPRAALASAPAADHVADDQIEDAAVAVFTASQGPAPMADKLGRIDAILRRLLGAASAPAAEPGPVNVPIGWRLSREATGEIIVNGPIGGCVVRADAAAPRTIPEELLHALAGALIDAVQVSHPQAQEDRQ